MSAINIFSASGCVSAAACAVALGWLGCARASVPPRPSNAAAAVGPAPATEPSQPSNLEVVVREVIQRAELDGLSYAKVFVDGVDRGPTAAAARSQEKAWGGRVEPGNRLLRLELWLLPGLGDWERLSDPLQPRERFVRVEPGARTRVRLRRRTDDGAYDFDVIREPM